MTEGRTPPPPDRPADRSSGRVAPAALASDPTAKAAAAEVAAAREALTGEIATLRASARAAVDVRANGTVAFPGLTNPNEVKADLGAGTISADVVLAGTSTVAIGPADVNLKEGTNTIVYAWGSAADSNLALAVQTITGLHSDPAGVPAGTGGQAASSADTTRLALIGGVALIAGSLVLIVRRRAVPDRA